VAKQFRCGCRRLKISCRSYRDTRWRWRRSAGRLARRLPASCCGGFRPDESSFPARGCSSSADSCSRSFHAAAPVPTFYVVMLAAGFGLGISCTVMTILMQSAVENRQRGMAMSTNALMNTLGQTVFAAIFGAVFNAFVSGDESGALAPGIRAVFLLVFAVMALTLPLLLRMPAVSGRELFGGRQSAGERQD